MFDLVLICRVWFCYGNLSSGFISWRTKQSIWIWHEVDDEHIKGGSTDAAFCSFSGNEMFYFQLKCRLRNKIPLRMIHFWLLVVDKVSRSCHTRSQWYHTAVRRSLLWTPFRFVFGVKPQVFSIGMWLIFISCNGTDYSGIGRDVQMMLPQHWALLRNTFYCKGGCCWCSSFSILCGNRARLVHQAFAWGKPYVHKVLAIMKKIISSYLFA